MMTSTGELFQRAFKAHKRGNLQDAETGYQEVLAAEPDHPSALHLLGLIAFDSGEIEKAIPLVERSVQLAPGEFQWLLNYGKILSKAGKNEVAIAAYEKALTMNSHSTEAGMSLGDLYVSSGNLNQASKVYYKMLCEAPHDAALRVKYGETLQALGKVNEAHDFIVRLATKPPDPPKQEEVTCRVPEVNDDTTAQVNNFPTGKLDPISECAFMSDALFRMGYRESAGLYATHGLAGMLNGKKPTLDLRELSQAWQVSSPGALFARMWIELRAYSMYYASFENARMVLEYWTSEEPDNPDPFLRLGLLQALTASRGRLAIPKQALRNIQRAHSLSPSERSTAALRLVENGPSLPELMVPYDQDQLLVYPDLKNVTTFVLLEQGDWFEDDITLFRDLVKPGDTVLDLGANVGVYAVSAAHRVGDEGRVIAVEPCGATFRLLQKSAEQSSNMRAVHAAVADVIGNGTLEADRDPELRRLVPHGSLGEVVDITTVDALAEREGVDRFDIIKMDVEGVEERALAGAKNTLTNGDPIVFFEVSEAGLGLVDVFQKHGYDSYHYCKPRKTMIKHREGSKASSFLLNMIAVRSSALTRFNGIVDIE